MDTLSVYDSLGATHLKGNGPVMAQISKDSMCIRCEETGPITILTPLDNLEDEGNAALAVAIHDTLVQQRHRILVSLENLDRIGYQTVQVLLDGASRAIMKGGDLRLLRPSRTIVRYLKNNKVHDKFRIYRDRGAAINEFLGIVSSSRAVAAAPSHPAPEPETQTQPLAAGNAFSVTEAGHILLTNSHMIATLIEVLCEKKILSEDDVRILLESGGDKATEERA
ncbi:MAG: STAS domain-containing protein [bacterium]